LSGKHAHALHYHGHSPVHRAAPEVKVLCLFLFILAAVATPAQAAWAFSAHAIILIAMVGVAGIPPRFFLTRLAIDVPFVLFALLLPFVGEDPRVAIGPLTVSESGLLGAWNILAKATLGAGASVLLVATTEVSQIIVGLQKLRVPRVLTAIASFMIRYLDVIAGELKRTRTAMSARGYDPTWMAQVRPLATAAGAIFVRSYERGERVHQAMLARGFGGEFPSSLDGAARPARWWSGLTPAVAAWLVMAIARVAT